MIGGQYDSRRHQHGRAISAETRDQEVADRRPGLMCSRALVDDAPIGGLAVSRKCRSEQRGGIKTKNLRREGKKESYCPAAEFACDVHVDLLQALCRGHNVQSVRKR